MLQKLAKVCKNICNILALAYCCSQSRWWNARNAYLLHGQTIDQMIFRTPEKERTSWMTSHRH